MTSKTHAAFAFASLVTVAAWYPPSHMSLLTFAGAIIANDIGALIPDLDTAGNRLWEFLPQGHNMGRVLRNIFYKHRTLTHSAIGAYLLYRGFDWLLPKIFNSAYVDSTIILYAIMIGIVSHLLSDSLTEEGIPVLFPINMNFGIPPIKALRVRTGSWIEQFIVYPLVWMYVIWFVYTKEAILLTIVTSLVK